VLVSSTDAAYSLTIASTSSSQYALTVMSWVAVVLFPIVLIYQGWTAYVFRARVSTRFAAVSASSST
jgi:cytochrome d ubiquinol oxidase subunit II